MQSRYKWDISSEEEEEVDPEYYDELLGLLIVHDHPATNLTHVLPTFGQPSLLNVGK